MRVSSANGTAENAAEIIALERRLGTGGEVVSRIHGGVAQILEGGAVEAALAGFVGDVHRGAGAAESSVRYQPPFLARSRCWQKSGGKLSCLTCHDPHARMRHKDAAYYRARCIGCHAGSFAPAQICLRGGDTDCVSCHMPLVAANAHIRFQNHWIGIYRDGAAIMPSGKRP